MIRIVLYLEALPSQTTSWFIHTYPNTNSQPFSITISIFTTWPKWNDTVTPSTWNLFVGDTSTSQYTVAVTKDNGTLSAAFSGQVCVTNGGSVDTQGLAIFVDLTAPPSSTVLVTTPGAAYFKPIYLDKLGYYYKSPTKPSFNLYDDIG